MFVPSFSVSVIWVWIFSRNVDCNGRKTLLTGQLNRITERSHAHEAEINYFGLVRQKGNERDKWGKHPKNEFRFVFVEWTFSEEYLSNRVSAIKNVFSWKAITMRAQWNEIYIFSWIYIFTRYFFNLHITCT